MPSYEIRLNATSATRRVLAVVAWKIREALAEVWGHRQHRWEIRPDPQLGAWAGWPGYAVDAIEYEEVELDAVAPPHAEPRPGWRTLYDPELARFVGLGWALAQENPLRRIFARARLTETPRLALELWLDGESVTAIARAIRRRRESVAASGTWRATRPGPGLILEALEAVEETYRIHDVPEAS